MNVYLVSQRHDCEGYGRLDPWLFVAARARRKGLPFRLFLAFVRWLERFDSAEKERKQNALGADLISGIEGVSFTVGSDCKGIVMGLLAGTSQRMSTIVWYFS